MNYAILSDIHGNMCALKSVIEDMKSYDISGVILLGDLIDYGMQSNEVIEYVCDNLNYSIICNIWGNHEQSIMLNDYSCFSSERGVKSAQYTSSILTERSKKYISEQMNREGIYSFEVEGKKYLAVHGSLDDFYWKSIFPDNLNGNYSDYDIVLSGHSHYSHMFSKFYDVNDPARRNKHAVLFINPGSVGQPRNHNNRAQYAILDTVNMCVNMRAVPYDIKAAMKTYDGTVDDFYCKRLKEGI